MQLIDIQARLQAFQRPDFTFNEDAHAYTLAGNPLTSWSKWIEQYVEPFPEQQAAAASASKRGVSPQVVLDEWEWSRTLGTLVHAWIEKFYHARIKGEPAPAYPAHPEVQLRCQKFFALYMQRLHKLTPVCMELQTFNERAGVAGTLDHGATHPERIGLFIPDWKTNGSLKLNAQVNRFTKRMRGPFADLYDNHETKYSLQNGFYRVLVEEAGVPTWGGAIVHLPPGDAPAVMIPAIDYRQRIRSLLF